MTGKNWYYEVNHELNALAIQYGLTLETVVGIFVTLSAQCPFNENMRLCKQFLARKNCYGITVTKSKLNGCKRILKGEHPLTVWCKTSHKYRAFYHSLLLIDEHPCIDTHMINLYLEQHPYSILFNYGYSSIFKSNRLLNPIRKWIMNQAKENNYKAFEMQSVLWVEQRGNAY